MSYTTCEDALATVIKKIDGFDSSNVSCGDYRVFASGQMKAVVLDPGAFGSHEKFDDHRHRTRWVVKINLFIAFTDEISTVKEQIREQRELIINMVDQYPTLGVSGGSIVKGIVESGEEPDVWEVGGGSRKWWHQVMYCPIEERVTVEYA